MKRPELKGKLVCLSCGYCAATDRFYHDLDEESFCSQCHGNDIHAADTVDWCEFCTDFPFRPPNTISSCEECLAAQDEELANHLQRLFGDDFDEGDIGDPHLSP